MRTWKTKVSAEDNGIRLSTFLYKRLKLTRRQISRLKFIENGIRVNDRSCKTDYMLSEGDEVSLLLGKTTHDLNAPDPVPALRILWENEDLICVHKPFDLAFHPSHGHYYDTLSIQLDALLKQAGRATTLHAVGRLDKDTSGIAVFAKHPIAAQRLQHQRQQGILEKEYLCIVHGKTKEHGTIELPIMKDNSILNRMMIHPDGKPAYTEYRKIKEGEDWSLLRVHIKTGRTHQIRLHMSSIHHPLLGDVLYGKDDHCPRLALHAASLSFHDPFSDEPVSITDHDDSFFDLIK